MVVQFSYYDDDWWRFIDRPASTASATTTSCTDDVLHAIQHELVSFDLEPDADPPKVLVIGPDSAGNLLEVIVVVLADDR